MLSTPFLGSGHASQQYQPSFNCKYYLEPPGYGKSPVAIIPAKPVCENYAFLTIDHRTSDDSPHMQAIREGEMKAGMASLPTLFADNYAANQTQ